MKTAPLYLQSKLVKKRCDYLRRFFNLIFTHHSIFILFAPNPHNFARPQHFSLHIHTISLYPHSLPSNLKHFRSTPAFFAPYPYTFARPTHLSLQTHTISLNSHIFRSKSIQFRSTLIFSAPYPHIFAQHTYFSLHILDTVPIE